MTGRTAAIVGLCLVGALGQLRAQDWQTMTTSRQLHGEETLSATVQFLSGTVRVFPADNRTLYKAQMRYDAEQFQPVNRIRPGSSFRLRVGLDTDDFKGDLDLDASSPQYLDVALPLAVTTDLRMELGIARADIELGGLAISRVDIQTGASESVMRFSSVNQTECSRINLKAGGARFELEGLGNSRCRRVEVGAVAGDITLDFTGSWIDGAVMDVEAKIGLGKLTLRIPQELGVRVDLDRFFASFEKAGLTKQGSHWYSPNYQDADARLEITIDALFGEVDVVWVSQRP
jgi:hypothetical protein